VYVRLTARRHVPEDERLHSVAARTSDLIDLHTYKHCYVLGVMEIVGVYERVLVRVGVLETYPATTLGSQKQWQHGVRVSVHYRFVYGGVVIVRQPVVSLHEQASVRVVCVRGKE
jgi:hypothetical protein